MPVSTRRAQSSATPPITPSTARNQPGNSIMNKELRRLEIDATPKLGGSTPSSGRSSRRSEIHPQQQQEQEQQPPQQQERIEASDDNEGQSQTSRQAPAREARLLPEGGVLLTPAPSDPPNSPHAQPRTQSGNHISSTPAKPVATAEAPAEQATSSQSNVPSLKRKSTINQYFHPVSSDASSSKRRKISPDPPGASTNGDSTAVQAISATPGPPQQLADSDGPPQPTPSAAPLAKTKAQTPKSANKKNNRVKKAESAKKAKTPKKEREKKVGSLQQEVKAGAEREQQEVTTQEETAAGELIDAKEGAKVGQQTQGEEGAKVEKQAQAEEGAKNEEEAIEEHVETAEEQKARIKRERELRRLNIDAKPALGGVSSANRRQTTLPPASDKVDPSPKHSRHSLPVTTTSYPSPTPKAASPLAAHPLPDEPVDVSLPPEDGGIGKAEHAFSLAQPLALVPEPNPPTFASNTDVKMLASGQVNDAWLTQWLSYVALITGDDDTGKVLEERAKYLIKPDRSNETPEEKQKRISNELETIGKWSTVGEEENAVATANQKNKNKKQAKTGPANGVTKTKNKAPSGKKSFAAANKAKARNDSIANQNTTTNGEGVVETDAGKGRGKGKAKVE